MPTNAMVVREDKAAIYYRTGIVFKPNVSIEDWARIGVMLEASCSASSWWIGDWLNYGESHFGEHKFLQASSVFSKDMNTVHTWSRISKLYPPEERSAFIPWSYYQSMASLPHRDRIKLLVECEPDNHDQYPKLNRTELRERVRELRAVYCDEKHDPEEGKVLLACEQESEHLPESLRKAHRMSSKGKRRKRRDDSGAPLEARKGRAAQAVEEALGDLVRMLDAYRGVVEAGLRDGFYADCVASLERFADDWHSWKDS